MQVTGELSSGAIGIMVTIAMAAIAWWVKSDRQSTRFDVLIAQMKIDIETNRTSFTGQLTEMKADARALAKAVDELKLQITALSAQQSMVSLFANLPEQLARAMGQARGQHWERQRNSKDEAPR